MNRRSIVLAALAALLTVAAGVALNVATGGTLPGPLRGYQGWAWPIVGVLTVATVLTSVLQAGHPTGSAVAPAAGGTKTRDIGSAQRVVGERVSTAVDVFRDRTEFRVRLRTLIVERPTPIISVTGRRGIGKSGLVAAVLADFEEPAGSDDCVDGLAYLSTRTGVGVLDMARIFHALVRLLPADVRDRLEEQWTNAGADALPDLFTALADRRTVLVLDNVDDLQDPETGRLASPDLLAFLTAVCSYRRPPVVVTTSQRPLGVPPSIGARVVGIEVDEGLAVDDAVEMLRHFDANGDAGLRDLPDADLRRAVEHVHGMPRGLELLVALMTERQTATLERIFEAHNTPEVLLEALVSEGFKSHDDVGRDVLRLFALAGTPLPVDAPARMLDGRSPAGAVTAAVEQMVNRRMLGFERATAQARLHPLDSDYVRRTLLDDPAQRNELDLRLADWLATQKADEAVWRTSADVAAQRREIRHRLRGGDRRGAVEVIVSIVTFLAVRGETDELSTALDQAFAMGTAQDSDPAVVAAYQFSRGVIEFFTGSLEAALAAFRAGRDAAEQTDDTVTRARLDICIGNCLRHMGAAAEAREPLLRAAALPATDEASRVVLAEALFVLGLVECYLGNAPAASAVAARIEATLSTGASMLHQAQLADLRALIALIVGDHATAIAEVERGVARYTDSPYQPTVGYLLNVRGLALLARGDLGSAAAVLDDVLKDAALMRQSRVEGFAGLNLAWTKLLDGDAAAAGAVAREAADRLAANRVSEAPSAVHLAAACTAGAPEERLALLRRAVAASHGNPDLYQPPDTVLAALAQTSARVRT